MKVKNVSIKLDNILANFSQSHDQSIFFINNITVHINKKIGEFCPPYSPHLYSFKIIFHPSYNK